MPTTEVGRSPNGAWALAVTLFWAFGMALVLWLSIERSYGRFGYNMDDPYIHLALAEMLLQGTWGVSPGDFASPSSSVLYAPMLAVFEVFGVGVFGPIVLTSLAAALSVWLLMRLFWSQAVPSGPPPLIALGVSAVVILPIGAWTLPMTGMEHMLHVAAVLAALTGLVMAAETGRMPVFGLVALIAMPLVRFEGIALAGAMLGMLLLLGQVRTALVGGIAVVATLGLYVLAMQAMGLPPLPSSVTIKSDVASEVGGSGGPLEVLKGVVQTFKAALDGRRGTLLAVAVCVLVGGALRSVRRAGSWRTPEMAVGVSLAVALLAHMAGGAFDFYGRYDAYATAAGLFGLVYLYRTDLRALFAERRLGQQVMLLGLMLVVAFPYGRTLYRTPAGARNIHEQQFQMHRFATEFFPHPVAANDLGWVSYRNDGPVLDLYGLGSEEVRRLKSEGRYDADAIRRLVAAKDVRYAMLYPQWFKDILPPEWCMVALLRTDKVATAFADVAFYAITPEDNQPLREAITQFRPTLPARVRLEEYDCRG